MLGRAWGLRALGGLGVILWTGEGKKEREMEKGSPETSEAGSEGHDAVRGVKLFLSHQSGPGLGNN